MQSRFGKRDESGKVFPVIANEAGLGDKSRFLQLLLDLFSIVEYNIKMMFDCVLRLIDNVSNPIVGIVFQATNLTQFIT